MGPRRKLQLALVVAAVTALILALTGAFGPAAGTPLPDASLVGTP